MNATQTATSGLEALTTSPDEVLLKERPAATCTETASALRGSLPNHRAVRRLKPRRKSLPLMGAVLSALALCYAGYRWWEYARAWVKTDNAYIASHIHTVSARVAGTVKEVLVDENQSVAAGTLLARLDDRDFAVAHQQAVAQLTQARAQLRQAEARIGEAMAQIAREQARATKAQQDLARAEALYQGTAGAISRQEFDQAKTEFQASQAAVEAAQAALQSAQALASAAQAQEQVTQANVDQTQLQLSYTEIRAPAAGRIGKKNLETGNRIQPGQALLALVEPEVWVTANFKETQLARMKSGQAVRVSIDALPGRTFPGRVQSLSPASGAQFALLPPDNATGNFTKIVQRVPVKVSLDTANLRDCLERVLPGMSVVVKVNVGAG